ncbi:MAG: enoyl-CoA hydratase/isomerase family protein [Candidatus Heimdallarchaeota archaeon]|nr:enoyl-CoA hydratase/isomerase family protein [Candidatus Heimdallarchaeota archaeon]
MKYLEINEMLEEKVVTIYMGLDTHISNSFTSEFLGELLVTLHKYADDERFNALILCSKSKFYSVGGDIKLMAKGLETGSTHEYLQEVVPPINKIVYLLVTFPIPVISIINGAAAGGGLSLALAADHIIATERAKLAMAFGSIGLTPDSGSSVLFSNRFGYAETLHGICTGKVYSAQEAKHLGAVDILVKDDEEGYSKAMQIAGGYGRSDRTATVETKRLLRHGLSSTLESQLEREYHAIVASSNREGFTQMLKQFLAKQSR